MLNADANAMAHLPRCISSPPCSGQWQHAVQNSSSKHMTETRRKQASHARTVNTNRRSTNQQTADLGHLYICLSISVCVCLHNTQQRSRQLKAQRWRSTTNSSAECNSRTDRKSNTGNVDRLTDQLECKYCYTILRVRMLIRIISLLLGYYAAFNAPSVGHKVAFNALTLLVGRQEGHPACKKLSGELLVWLSVWSGADLHMAQLMPLPLTVSCFSKIQIGFTFLVPAHLGSRGKGPLNGCVCVYIILIA